MALRRKFIGAQVDYRSCGFLQPFGVVGMVEEHSVGIEVGLKRPVERTEETMPAQVAIKQVRILLAESLRFPEEGQSAQG